VITSFLGGCASTTSSAGAISGYQPLALFFYIIIPFTDKIKENKIFFPEVFAVWFMYIIMLGIGIAVGAVLMGVYLLDGKGNRRRDS
jgi:hypothetical protein